MINILKLRKLEKENKQRKTKEENPEEETVGIKEVPEITAEFIPPVKKSKPAKKKKETHAKKGVSKMAETEEENNSETANETGNEITISEQEPVQEKAEDNPVELFRQNLLKELLNSDTLPEYSDPRFMVPEEASSAAVSENSSEEVIKQEIQDQPEAAVLNEIAGETKEEKPGEVEINHIIEKTKKNHDNLIHLVSFSLGRENYGVDIMRIREIIRMVDITKVPRAPEFIEGVINLRGSVIPVINLRTRIKLPRKEYDKSTRIIVLEMKQSVIGFIVDEVKEVLRISESIMAPPPLLTVGKNVDYITSVAKLDNCLIILIDPERLLTSSELDKLKK